MVEIVLIERLDQDPPEGHRNSDHARDLPIHEVGPRTDQARPQGLEHARDALNAGFLSLKHSSLGYRASPHTRCRNQSDREPGVLSMTGRRNESQVSGMI